MRVFVHIATEYEFMDHTVQIAIECVCTPRIGDTFFLRENDIRELEKAVIRSGKDKVKQYSSWIYGPPGNFWLSFDDCIFVSDCLWRSNRQGVYEYHICLNSEDKKNSDPPEKRLGRVFTNADYAQIIDEYEK